MGLGAADIARMSLWEYEARLWHWIDMDRGHDDVADRPDPHQMQAMVDRLNEHLRRER